ncbi:MAG: hypothetical protein EPO07_17140, partial [Verrucomicrobia bacterium]
MKINTSRCLLGMLAMLLTGCETPYHKFSMLGGGGYQDKELEPGVYKASFMGNGYTSQERVIICTLYRCAEITHENGYDYFAFVTERGNVSWNWVPVSANLSYRIPNFSGETIFRTFKGEKPTQYP